MPLKIRVNTSEKWIYPSTKWKEIKVRKGADIRADKNFYVDTKKVADLP